MQILYCQTIKHFVGRLSEAKAENFELCFNASCGKKKLISFVYFFKNVLLTLSTLVRDVFVYSRSNLKVNVVHFLDMALQKQTFQNIYFCRM